MNTNKRIVGVVNKCEPQQIMGWLADLNNLQDHFLDRDHQDSLGPGCF